MSESTTITQEGRLRASGRQVKSWNLRRSDGHYNFYGDARRVGLTIHWSTVTELPPLNSGHIAGNGGRALTMRAAQRRIRAAADRFSHESRLRRRLGPHDSRS
jgi:hypothetical protein